MRLPRSLTSLALAALFASLPVAPALAGNGSIGLLFDADCGSCGATATVGVPLYLYVSVALAGSSAAGIAGAEFRVAGVPTQWFVQVTPNPLANIVVGDPLGQGCIIAFPSCADSPSDCVNLFTVWLYPTTTVENVRLRATWHTTPCNCWFPCPTLVLCDAPVYTKLCAQGGEAILNGPPCTVGVEAATWSGVKRLYD